MNQSEIAKRVNAPKSFVTLVLNGKRNPQSPKAIQVLIIAAELQAEIFKAEYISSYIRNWNLKKTLKNR